jgi:hypothetical protein
MDRVDLLLKARANSGRPFEATVRCESMNPVLFDGDIITIQKQNDYRVGDVLVYPYYGEGLLIHRLLRKSGNMMHCKGDNSFRIEEVDISQVVGKAVSVNDGNPVKPRGLKLLFVCWASLHINKLLVKHHNCLGPVVGSVFYRGYRLIYSGRKRKS